MAVGRWKRLGYGPTTPAQISELLFVGTDEDAAIGATFVSLLASCELHGLEPWAYLRDLFCLLPRWPRRRVLELAPANWQQTLEHEDTQQRLAANVFRQVTLAEHHPQK